MPYSQCFCGVERAYRKKTENRTNFALNWNLTYAIIVFDSKSQRTNPATPLTPGEVSPNEGYNSTLNAKFFDLKQEKQDRMINAALKIFAQNGYKHASTDDIVKEAGISKGLLFHYFDSKIGVYSFLYDYSARYMQLELSSAVDPEETSYMALRRQMEAARMQSLKTYPYMELFLKTAAKETVEEAVSATKASKEAYETALSEILGKADMETFRAAKNSDKFLKMLDYTTEGIMRESFAGDTFDAQKYYKEVIAYIDLIDKTLA